MPKGKTASTLGLSQRREQAFRRFLQGWNNVDVAKDIGVTAETVARYRNEYQEQITTQARENPRLLLNVIPNTVQSLHELEAVRKATWDEYEENVDRPAIRQQCLRTLTSIQAERAKLLGLFGVKQEFLLHVQNVQHVQQRILDWMRQNLCAEDREKLTKFLTTELAEYMPESQAPPADLAGLPEPIGN